MRNKAITVVLADDHTIVRQGLAKLLEGEPNLRVVGEAENGREAGEKENTEEITTAEAAAELAEQFLELDAKLKALKAEHEALKGDLTNAAQSLDVNKLQAPSGTVSVSRKTVDKFITKSQDGDQFANLSFVVRQLGLDDYLQPDTSGILKDIYGKGRLSEEDEKKLAEFVITKEEIRVSARPKKRSEEDED